MNQTSLVGRPLSHLVGAIVGFAEKRGVWSGPLMSSSPELARLWEAPSTSTGIGVNEAIAYTYSVFWACVNDISMDIAAFPLMLYKRESNGGKTVLRDHKLFNVLHDLPNHEMTAFTFRGLLTSNALTGGMGYAEIVRDGGGRVSELWPITPDRVTVHRETRPPFRVYYDVSRQDGGIDRLSSEEMFVLPGSTVDGVNGRNIINMARESIGLGLAAERFGGSFFGNGATFGGVITLKEHLTEQARKSFREQTAAQHQGVDRAHKFLLLGNEASYQKLGVDPNHAQFVETRQHQVEEMCRWFRMPPHKVQHLIRTSYNSAEQLNIEYTADTLTPWCVRWEQEILRQLIAPSERRIQFVKHNMDSKLRGDTATRYEAYSKGIQNGFLSADDVREKEDMNPLPDGQGKTYLIPSNMAPADRIDEIVDKQVAPDPKPQAPAPEPNMKKDDDMMDADRMAGAIRTALVDVEARLVETATQIADLRAEKVVSITQAGTLRAALDALEAQHAEAQAEANRLRPLLLEATERADQLAAEQEAMRAAQADVDAQRATADQLMADTTANLLAVTAQVASLQADRDRLDADCLEATARAEQVTSDHQAALEALRTTAEAERMAAEQRVTELQALATTAEADRDARIVELGTLEHALAEARTQVQTVTTELDTLRTHATATAEVAEAAKIAAEAATSSVVAIRSAAEQATAEQGALLATEQAARAELTVAFQTTKQAEAARLQALLTAHRDLFLDAMARLIWKETERARKNKGTPAKLQAWADSFYLLHEETCIDALRPAMRTHLVLIRSSLDVDTATRELIHPHLETAIAQLRAVAKGDEEEFPVAIERLLTRWEQERPAAIADLVFQEEMTYVRSL